MKIKLIGNNDYSTFDDLYDFNSKIGFWSGASNIWENVLTNDEREKVNNWFRNVHNMEQGELNSIIEHNILSLLRK